ncbi:hypothetical protein [Undibacterium flavidum]|uniref:Uncharacterized protein n=1 Tax=Undibacterium flavidum TaxID=2762297 RepID=A0ABR6YCU6_9BURK|nr:hypothetical protein [Undibacterium flavidum]MBC3874361.1 hypothetical protein [Undibacterium flavidum]
MATPNYGYEKRQKELAKKRKKEEKLKNRAERGSVDADDNEPAEVETTDDYINQKNEPA